MSSDFSEIMAAMSQVPDIEIDPNSGTTMRASGKTLGQKYQMEDKVSPKMAEKIRENALLNEEGKEASKSTVDAYKEMIGRPTSTQVKEYHKQVLEAQQKAQAAVDGDIEQLQAFMENKDVVQTQAPILNEQQQYSQVNDNMMDMYVNSIHKKNKWRKK